MTYNTKMKHMKNKNISEKRKERFCKANISGNLTGFSLDIYSSMVHNLQCDIKRDFDIPFRTEIFIKYIL